MSGALGSQSGLIGARGITVLLAVEFNRAGRGCFPDSAFYKKAPMQFYLINFERINECLITFSEV